MQVKTYRPSSLAGKTMSGSLTWRIDAVWHNVNAKVESLKRRVLARSDNMSTSLFGCGPALLRRGSGEGQALDRREKLIYGSADLAGRKLLPRVGVDATPLPIPAS